MLSYLGKGSIAWILIAVGIVILISGKERNGAMTYVTRKKDIPTALHTLQLDQRVWALSKGEGLEVC